ncbi:uncharacterized protein ACJ7VT_012653 [Polymixia lowei]
MYHHHSQQQGPPQPFSNRPRPSHNQQQPNQQQQSRSATDILSQVLGFQFPPPTQLPDELESALAIRGSRDMDHRLVDHTNRPNRPVTLTSDNPLGHQQGVDWSSYQQPSKLFATPPSSTAHQSHQSQRHQGPPPQQQPQNSHSGTGMQSWNAPDSHSPQARGSHGSGNGGGDVQGLYTPESAGSILASFGLSNEDLEVLSHYPDDQLTPDTLPFILRDIQINKSHNQNNTASSSSSSYSQSLSRSIHDMPPPPARSSPLRMGHSNSPEVPSLLSVTQTAGKVIDYGHASRATDESSGRETFKREPLSSERKVKMVYPSSSSSAPKLKVEMPERRHVRLEPAGSNKYGDLDYRRDMHKTKRSPTGEFPQSSKPRRPDQDYRQDRPKSRPSSEIRSESLSSSRRSLSSSSASKPHSSTKRLPTPTMISDFSAEPPKVYPHTCSLCHIQCDQAEDWLDHVNTVNHTAACRDLRNKYPKWKPNLPRRDPSLPQDGSRAPWHTKERSPSRSISRSLSWSPSPPPSKHRVGPHHQRQHGRPYPPHHRPRHQHQTGVSTGCSSRSDLKRPHGDSVKRPVSTSRHSSFSSVFKAGQRSKPGQFSAKGPAKMGTKPATKTTKPAASKAAASKEPNTSAPQAKKKKKAATSTSQTAASRLVYLTGIPTDASEQEVTNLVGSFGKINNVVLMPGSEEEGQKVIGQKASACMMRTEDAQALAQCTSLSIRDQQITASLAKKTEAEKSLPDPNNRNPDSKKSTAGGEDQGSEAKQKTSNELQKGMVLISGLPESGWSESDIIKLAQPFGTPSDIILATEIRKVLVYLPDVETADEMVKVHTFIPVKISDAELKMSSLRQPVSLSTPVALYNLLKGPLDPFGVPSPVGWSSLLVISNVPDTPTGPSEVQRLVQRFGNVQNTLVLDKNMIICEMATAAVALAVYKRFQKFPCIIQNNPLFFSRRADPKPNTQSKVIPAYLDLPKASPADSKDSLIEPAGDKLDLDHKDNGESVSEAKEKESDGKDGEKTEGDEKIVGEDKVAEKELSKDGDDEVKTIEVAAEVSDAVPGQELKLEADMQKAETQAAVVTPANEKPGENKTVDATQAGNTKAPSDQKQTETSSDDGGDASSSKSANPDLPKVTQEMVEALLEECRTRTVGCSNQNTSPPGGEQAEANAGTTGGESGVVGRKEEEEQQEEEKKKKKQEKERKEREVKREKERKERERREREREERAKRDRERREEEKRERERRERRRTHREDSAGSRSSGISEGGKRSSTRDGQDRTTVALKSKKMVEDEFDNFPFDMGDFVTIDEVGDVTDLPHSPSAPMDTTEEAVESHADALSVSENTPTSVTPEATPTPIAVATAVPDATTLPEKSEVLDSEPAPVTAPAAAPAPNSETLTSLDLKPGPALTPEAPQATCSSGQTAAPVPQSQPETAPGTVTTPMLDSTPAAESLPTPAQATTESPPETTPVCNVESPTSSVSPAPQDMQEEEEEKGQVNHSQAGPGGTQVVLEKPEGMEQPQDEGEKEETTSAVGAVKRQWSEDQREDNEECVKKKQKTPESYSLPPFDPASPVGMEFLVPKTGFFCKVCNRFFSGNKEAEMNHCKTLKHYEYLQKYLQTRKTANTIVNPNSR